MQLNQEEIHSIINNCQIQGGKKWEKEKKHIALETDILKFGTL